METDFNVSDKQGVTAPQSEHPDQAPTLTIVAGTRQCGHAVSVMTEKQSQRIPCHVATLMVPRRKISIRPILKLECEQVFHLF